MRRNHFQVQKIPTPNFGNLKLSNGQRFNLLPPNEFGFPMCALPDGNLARNVPVSWGSPMSVDIDTNCPANTRFVGVFHTHPKGVAFPSRQDQIAAIQSGAEVMCIQNDSEMNCYRIRAVGNGAYANVIDSPGWTPFR